MLRQMLPGRLCAQIPQIVNEKLSGKLNNIPQSIALTQLLESAFNLLGLSNILQSGGGRQVKKIIILKYNLLIFYIIQSLNYFLRHKFI